MNLLLCVTEALAATASLIWLVPLLPFLAALIIGARLGSAVAGDDAEPATVAVARGAALGVLVLLAAIAAGALGAGVPGVVSLGEWMNVPGIRVAISFTVDALSLSVACVVAFIGWATLHFSAAYLHREPGFHRFFLALCLLLAGMLLLVLAGNAVVAFVGWELCGISSWMLIGFADERPTATGNALFGFLTNRIGDAGFLLGIGLSFWWLGSVEWSMVAAGDISETVKARLLALGFVTAALAKSAQLPFTPWIARALEGPTPSSAVYYGAVMVHAGVYLLLRCEPLLLQVPDMMAALALAGAATAIYAWLCGRVQTDVKTALLYATVSHVGLMVMACGLGWFALAQVYLLLHALWRGYQFLLAPSYLQLAPSRPAPLPQWLAGNTFLYTAALQRFWIDRVAHGLLTRPTLALGRDVREFDDHVLDRLIGAPREPLQGTHLEEGTIERVQGNGIAGRALLRLADLLQSFETRLILEGEGGAAARLLQRVGGALKVVEALLEQPRYLMLMVMATFVVIL
jgi:formate hydrogenlyase subunit 3/multisubunit Na+/H+ antiporter MnhD subunit